MKGDPLKRQVNLLGSQFLEATTIHGLAYLANSKSDGKIIVKLFWGLIASAGMVATLVVFHQSENERLSAPLITTLDSLAVSVGEIQFPSVTVCQDFQDSPDTWSLAQKVANSFSHGCWKSNENCSGLAEVHDKFAFLLDRGHESFKAAFGKVFQGNLTQHEYFKKLRKSGEYKRVMTVLADFDDFVSVDRLVRKNFPRYSKLSTLLHTEAEGRELLASHAHNSTQKGGSGSLDEFILRTLLLFKFRIRDLGSMISIYAPDFSETFQRFPTYRVRENYSFKELQDVNQVQQSFVDILIKLGGSKENNISLLDLPNLVHYGGRPSQLFSPTLRHVMALSAARNPHLYSISDSDELKREIHSHYRAHRDCAEQWESYVQGLSTAHPLGTQSTKCHQLDVLHILNNDFTLLMKLMKQVYHLGSADDYTDDFLPYLSKSVTEGFNSPLADPEKAKKNFQQARLHMIPICSFVSDELVKTSNGILKVTDCKLFNPINTEQGICQSFNALPRAQLLKSSPYSKAMNEAFGADEIPLENGIAGDSDSGLKFYLDRKTFLRRDTRIGYEEFSSTFHLSINNVLEGFKVSVGSTKVRVGYETVITVRPTQLVSDPSLRNLDFGTRNCRFADEILPDSIFKIYTQSLCQFECKMRWSREKCHCIPWDFPSGGDVHNRTVCDILGAYCFRETMKTVTGSDCHCLPDCETIQFTHQEKEWPLDPRRECHRSRQWLQYSTLKTVNTFNDVIEIEALAKYGIKIGQGPLQGDRYQHFIEHCKAALAEDIAVVKVQFASGHFVRSRQSIRMSFVERVASFGGTLGLLTGMSFVSIVELFFWLSKLVFSLLPRKSEE